MTYFATGFQATIQCLLQFSGGIAAVVVFLVALLLIVCLADAAFDIVTRGLAKRWEKQGRKPRGKFEKIVREAYRRRE